MKTITLTKGKIVQVDDEDYEYLNQWKWFAKPSRNTFYAARMTVTSRKLGKRKQSLILMHRLIMKNPEGMLVDHKDRDGLNNQKSNLRVCRDSENKKNRFPSITSTSKYLGVCMVMSRYVTKKGTRKKYWYSAITVKGKTKYLGIFPYTLEGELAAAKRYDEEALKEHKEFANLNFKIEE